MQTHPPEPFAARQGAQALLLVLGGSAIVVLLLLALNHFLVQPAFHNLQQDQALEDNERASAALANELATLADLAHDWAHWDDAYAFVQKPEPAFIASNCPSAAVLSENSGIDLLAFFNQAGELLLVRAFHPSQGRDVSLALLAGDTPPARSLLAPAFTQSTPMHGLVETEHGLLLLVADPVLTSAKKGPARGTLLMGRFLDGNKIERLAERTKVPITIAFGATLTGTDRALFERLAATANAERIATTAGAVYRVLDGIDNKPLALLRTPVRGEIALIGAQTGRLLASVLGGIALVLLVCLAVYRWRMKRAQHALATSEARYRQLFEAESDALFLIDKATGRILEANQAAADLYGYDHDELLRLRNTDLSAEPEQTREVTSNASCAGDRVVTVPLRWHRKKDGTVFPVEITGRFFLHQGQAIHIAAVRDITERKRIEDRLRFTQFAVDRFGDGAFWINRDGRLQYVNEAGCRSLGYTPDELIGKTVADIDPIFPFAEWPAYWQQLQADKHALIESLHKTKDGRLFPIEVQANYVAFGDQEFNCAIVRDISERKRLEKERAELEAMNWQLHKEESLGRMAGAIAHHFNNKLMAIMGCIELALDYQRDFDDNAVQRELHQALASANKAAHICRSLLIYLGQGSGEERRPMDLSEVCRQHLPVLQAIVPTKITLLAKLPIPGPVVVLQVERMLQILTNLVTNSVEAFDKDREGWIRLEVGRLASTDLGECTIFPAGWQARDPVYACLSVADNGCGIAAEDREPLFDPFFSRKFTGRGLGLPVVLGLTKALGGAVAVESTPGEGSLFRILLPLADNDGTPAIADPER